MESKGIIYIKKRKGMWKIIQPDLESCYRLEPGFGDMRYIGNTYEELKEKVYKRENLVLPEKKELCRVGTIYKGIVTYAFQIVKVKKNNEWYLQSNLISTDIRGKTYERLRVKAKKKLRIILPEENKLLKKEENKNIIVFS